MLPTSILRINLSLLLASVPSLIPVAVSTAIPRQGPQCQVTLGSTAVSGQVDGGGCRYVVEYATASRWETSSLVTDFAGHTSASLPPACPQDASPYVTTSQSEDCLWQVVYTPSSPAPPGGRSVLFWIHGGSSVAGSASAPGLDGSHLATNGDIIVVVIQYRLGLLGFIPPASAPSDSDPNLGLQDIINALQSVHDNIAAFGGDPNKVTIAGQSSGGGMVRALLGAPSASALFRAGIIQSDPMTYGFATTDITSQLQHAVYSTSPLSACSDLACLESTSTSNLLSAQGLLVQVTPSTIEGVPFAEVIRPTFGPATLPSDPTSAFFSDPASLANVPLLITTTANEGGQAVSQIYSNPVNPPSNSVYVATMAALVGSDRAQAVASNSLYALPGGSGDGDVLREKFELAVTDGTWRCPNREVARSYAAAGRQVWVGEWTRGETYPTNSGSSYCTTNNRVCHEDDLYPTFGTGGSDVTLESDITTYWSNFVKSLDPGSSWPALSGTSTGISGIMNLGGGQVIDCPEGFWGDSVKYDWQLYG